MPASSEQELRLTTTVELTNAVPFTPSLWNDQSSDNCSGGQQSQQSCNCSGGVSSHLWTATAAGAVAAVFSYTTKWVQMVW